MKVGFANSRWLLAVLLVFPCFGAALGIDESIVDPYGAQYGNAQSMVFQKAIRGGLPLRLDEQASLDAMVPRRIDQRFYGSLRYNTGTFALSKFRNKSTDSNKGAIVNIKSTSSKQKSFSVMMGYQFSKNIRADLEYFGRKTLHYNANPVLTGTGIIPTQLQSTLKGNTIFLNAYYDVLDQNQRPFTPYLGGGVGLSKYTITSTLSPASSLGASKSTTPLKPALSVVAGIKMRLFGDAFVDLSYRMMQLGANLQFRANSGFMMDASNSANVLGLGLIYVF